MSRWEGKRDISDGAKPPVDSSDKSQLKDELAHGFAMSKADQASQSGACQVEFVVVWLADGDDVVRCGRLGSRRYN